MPIPLRRPPDESVTHRGRPPVTPDGRYFVVRGRLWRCTNPTLAAEERERLVGELMRARREKGAAMRTGDTSGRERARAAVDRAKVALGERGPVWWTGGTPDWNRQMAVNTPYATWFLCLQQAESQWPEKIFTSVRAALAK